MSREAAGVGDERGQAVWWMLTVGAPVKLEPLENPARSDHDSDYAVG